MADFPGAPSVSVLVPGRTAETHLICPDRRAAGETSAGSSASVYRVKFSGTFQMKTLPSSDAEAMSESLNGLLRAVSLQPAG